MNHCCCINVLLNLPIIYWNCNSNKLAATMLRRNEIVVILIYTAFTQADYSFLERVCKLPVDAGKKCGDSDAGEEATMYHYDKDTQRCNKFAYLGCEGNPNKFASQDDCIDSCQIDWFMKQNKEEEKRPTEPHKKSDCQLEPVQGRCRAYIIMWYYNPKKKACEMFGFGGCNGNGNKFDTQRECETFCGDKT